MVARPDRRAGAAASEALTVPRRAVFVIAAGAVLVAAGLLVDQDGGRPAGRILEIQLRTSAGEFAQLSWAASSGFHAEKQPLARTPDGFQSLRFPLPGHALESVRLTPVDRPGEAEIAQLRVLEADGSVVRELSVRSTLHPELQIASMEREGRRVRIVTDPGATAPSLSVTPACLAEPSAWYSLASVTPLSLALGACAFVALLIASIAVLAAGSPVRADDPAITRWSPAMWLALLFLLIVSGKLLLLHVYPARVPYLDQWDAEAAGVYIPFDEGCLSWGQMVAFHNEHRVFFTRLLALALLAANGQWDPQLQQVVNTGLHALTALVLGMMFWRAADGRRLNLVVVFCAVLFTLPFGWENTLAGFQSSFYLLLLFSVLALALTVKRVGSGAWVLGWLCAVSSLVTTAGGLFTPVAISIAAALRLVTRQTHRRGAVVNLGMSAAVFALGLSLVSPAIGLSATLAPHRWRVRGGTYRQPRVALDRRQVDGRDRLAAGALTRHGHGVASSSDRPGGPDGGPRRLGRDPGGRARVRPWRRRHGGGVALHGHPQPRRRRKCHGLHRAVRTAARVSARPAVRDCRAGRVVAMRNRRIGTERRDRAGRRG